MPQRIVTAAARLSRQKKPMATGVNQSPKMRAGFKRTLGFIVTAVLCGFPHMAPALTTAERASMATLEKPSAAGAGWGAAEIAVLRRDVDAMLSGATTLRGAHVGLYAIDTRTGSVLYARNIDDAFSPASNLKLLTGSVALARLGTGFRFHTSLLGTGSATDGTLQGDLVLRGGGDPFLLASDLEAAVKALGDAGIRRIAGGVKVDASYFDQQRYGLGWSWDDFPFYYAAPISAMSLEENVVHITVTPGSAPGENAAIAVVPRFRVESSSVGECPFGQPDARVSSRALTGTRGSTNTVDVERDSCGTIVVSGSIALGAKPVLIDAAVPSAERYALDVFAQALSAHGIAFDRRIDPARWDSNVITSASRPAPEWTVLWRHESETMPELLADFWYPSDNLLGEVLLKSLGVARSGAPGRSASGIELETEFLREIGIDPKTVSIVDGSGLSSYDRITARALVAILQYDWNSPARDVVLDALPVAGVRGTLKLRYIGTPAEKRVFAKTGSVSHARNLSGYIATRRHGAVTFSWLVDDWLGEAGALRTLRGRVLSRFVTD